MAEVVDRAGGGRVRRILRIGVAVACVLAFFYVGVNFRVMKIPDYYVVLHPLVLPGEYWVYRYSPTVGEDVKRGDIVLFVFRGDAGRVRSHISRVVGLPGETVEYFPLDLSFRVNGKRVEEVDLHLSPAWRRVPRERIVLGRNEYLLFDNNATEGDRRLWRVEKACIVGRFLFRLPL